MIHDIKNLYLNFSIIFSDRRYNDSGSNRIVHAPTVRIADTNGVNADEVADALTSGAKAKKKAYRKVCWCCRY